MKSFYSYYFIFRCVLSAYHLFTMHTEKELHEKMEQQQKLANLEIQNIYKELQVKTEIVNEQLNVISTKDDKIATQKLELEKAKEGTYRVCIGC